MAKKILLVENDEKTLATFNHSLEEGSDLEIITAGNVGEALQVFNENKMSLVAAVIDLHLPMGVGGDVVLQPGLHPSGHALARWLHKEQPKLRIFGISNEPPPPDQECGRFFRSVGEPNRTIGVYSKRYEWVLLRHHLYLHTSQPSSVKVFIVYGHDHTLRDEAINYCKEVLHWDAVYLEPTNGNTWIEQFEEQANEAALAWVLATDDEWGAPRDPAPRFSAERRPRPNVILEYGYFLGRFGRKSHRVFLFSRPEVKLGSDVSDVAHIQLPGKFADADADIRGHHRVWLLPEQKL